MTTGARGFGLALLATSVATLGILAGEETVYDKSLKQTLGALDKMTMTLAMVKDEETAQATKPEWKKAVQAWEKVKAEAAKLPPPEQAEKDRIAKEYRPKLDAAVKKFFTEVARVRMIPAGKELLKEVKNIKSLIAP
jgi:hypothetical protein